MMTEGVGETPRFADALSFFIDSSKSFSSALEALVAGAPELRPLRTGRQGARRFLALPFGGALVNALPEGRLAR